jgi:hypothetical protein
LFASIRNNLNKEIKMALKPFNSVAGFSTGEAAVTIIDGNGNVSSNSLSVLASANIIGNISAGNVLIGSGGS